MRKLLFILLGCGLLVTGYFLFRHNGRFHQYTVGKAYTVRFHFPDLARQEFTDREKADQDRDWMLYSLVAGAGLDKKQFAQVSYDLAPVRYGFNSTIANFDFGVTRVKYLGDGEAVALIPESDENNRNDNIAHVLDEVRKNQGEIPGRVYLFEYVLNTEGNFARMTRQENVDVKDFFTAKKGYFEKQVGSVEDLRFLMDHIDDLTYAKRDGNTLVLGGRRLSKGGWGKATPEDVAAIWQSESAIARNAEQRKSGVDNIERDYKVALKNVSERFIRELKDLRLDDGRLFSDLTTAEQNTIISFVTFFMSGNHTFGSRQTPLIYQPDRAVRDLVLRVKKEVDDVKSEFEEKAKGLKGEPGGETAGSTGFSLDPAVDCTRAMLFVERYRDAFAEALGAGYTVDELIEQLSRGNGDLMEYAIARLDEGSESSSTLSQLATMFCMYQHARYDGTLQGTAAGMTLFYTDLLAKLWAANMFNSHPDVNITGFKDLEQASLQTSVVFEEEASSLPSCRLWFGPNQNGFQMGQGKLDLFFARNATQIFALSSNDADPKSLDSNHRKTNKEVQASKEFEVVLSWWNNHYEEVGEYEHQYQRLNEIMKWSTLISWLNNATLNSGGASLDFLDKLPVDHSQWFPVWAKSQKDLKFPELTTKVEFYEKGRSGSKTEAIPILFSRHGWFSGGVSLADRTLLSEAPEIISAEKNLIRRGNLSVDPTDADAFRTFKETKIKFTEDAASSEELVSLQPKEGLKLRNRSGEVANTQIEVAVADNAGKGFTMENKIGGLPIGKLRVEEEVNGFRIGFDGDAVDKGLAISREISDWQGDAELFFRNHPEVRRAVRAADGTWCVQVKGSDKWLLMDINAKASVNLPSGWTARVSGTDENSRIVELKWLEESDVKTLLNGKELPPAKPVALSSAEQRIEQLEQQLALGQMNAADELTKLKLRAELEAALHSFESGNVDAGVGYLNEMLASPVPGKDAQGFLNEVNNMIEHAAFSDEAKRKFKSVFQMYFSDDDVAIAGVWEGYKSLAKEVPLEQVLNGKGVKVIYDNAAFQHMDPQAPFESTVGRIRAMSGVKAYDISGQEIGKNTRIYASLEKNPGDPPFDPDLDLTRTGFDRQIAQLKVRVFPGSNYNDCQHRDKNGNCEDKYSAKGHIYFVTVPSLN